MIEVILSIALLAMFASTLFVYIGTQLLDTTESAGALAALEQAQEGLEAARAIRDADWTSLAAGAHGVALTSGAWTFQGASDASNGLSRVVTVSDLSTDERQVVSTVTWQTPNGQTRSTSLATNLSNWRNAAQPLLWGNWGNPQTLGTIDLGAGVAGTGVRVRSKYVYMTGTASTQSKNDFFVINATDGTHPTIAASMNTGPGLNALAISGNYAYVANDSESNQLQIIDISTTSSPSLTKSFSLPGDTETPALSVAVSGTYLIMGAQINGGPELYMIDVSNPAAPVVKSTLEISANVNRIVVSGNRAFLATSNSAKEFMVVDISNPLAMAVTAQVNLPGSNAAKGLYVNEQDHRAYIVRDQASGTSPEINIYDVTNPDAPTLLGSSEFSSGMTAVFAADTLMFLATSVSNLEFQIFTATDPQATVYLSGLNFPQVGNDIAFESNIIYIAVRSNDALRIVTSQ